MTLNILEDFLMDFPGCVLIVSHDRFFLDKIAQHLFIFEEGGNIRDWNGLYTEYREVRKEELSELSAERSANAASSVQKSAPAAAPTEQLSQEQRKAIRRVEGQIGKLEDAKTKINKQFEDAANLAPDKIAELSKKLNELNEEIEEKEMEWMELVG